jgi:hypothetical protein
MNLEGSNLIMCRNYKTLGMNKGFHSQLFIHRDRILNKMIKRLKLEHKCQGIIVSDKMIKRLSSQLN